jgi:hypothetical protein
MVETDIHVCTTAKQWEVVFDGIVQAFLAANQYTDESDTDFTRTTMDLFFK